MLLYHGTNKELESIKPNQAGRPEDRKKVPDGELLNAIYLTPEFDFALAMAARVEGVTQIHNHQIEFEKPELFDPNKEVYVYEIDTESLKGIEIKRIDEKQYVIEGVDEIKPTNVHKLRSKELLNYYELVNWKDETKPSTEFNELNNKLR